MKYLKLFQESLDMFDKNAQGYIDISILMDLLSEIADETGNNLKYPSENFREVPFGGGERFKSWNRKDLSYRLEFSTFISTEYYTLIKQVLNYYYEETGDEIICFLYSKSTSYIEKLYFMRKYVLENIVKLNYTDSILTKNGFYLHNITKDNFN